MLLPLATDHIRRSRGAICVKGTHLITICDPGCYRGIDVGSNIHPDRSNRRKRAGCPPPPFNLKARFIIGIVRPSQTELRSRSSPRPSGDQKQQQTSQPPLLYHHHLFLLPRPGAEWANCVPAQGKKERLKGSGHFFSAVLPGPFFPTLL